MKLDDATVITFATGSSSLASLDEVANMAKELKAARRLIAAFGSMLVGCREQTFSGWANGNGTNVGDKIDAARRAYAKA